MGVTGGAYCLRGGSRSESIPFGCWLEMGDSRDEAAPDCRRSGVSLSLTRDWRAAWGRVRLRVPKAASTGVTLVRGPFVQLPPHAEECDEDEFLAYAAGLRADGAAACGRPVQWGGRPEPGLEAAGYRVVLGIDRDREATETHRHHFGGLTLDWDLGKPGRVARVAQLVQDAGVELLAGGPPCQPFSRAGRSKIRHRILNGFADPSEERRHLWRSFLEVVTTARPPAVLMENVPDMALDKDMFILRTMVHELESLGYAVEERVVDTSQYGVPQFRQRLILVALRGGTAFAWPPHQPDQVTVWNAIGDLPPVEGGARPEGGASGWGPTKDRRTPSSGGCGKEWTAITPTGFTTTSRARSARTTRSPSST